MRFDVPEEKVDAVAFAVGNAAGCDVYGHFIRKVGSHCVDGAALRANRDLMNRLNDWRREGRFTSMNRGRDFARLRRSLQSKCQSIGRSLAAGCLQTLKYDRAVAGGDGVSYMAVASATGLGAFKGKNALTMVGFIVVDQGGPTPTTHSECGALSPSTISFWQHTFLFVSASFRRRSGICFCKAIMRPDACAPSGWALVRTMRSTIPAAYGAL